MKILNTSIAVCSVAIMLFFTQCRKDNTPSVPINRAPIANANNLITNMPKDSVELDGSGSVDPDGDPITYKWTYISGPGGSVIRKDTEVKTFVAKLREGIYKFLLTVTDSKSASATAVVTVIVNDAPGNPPIVITLSPPSQTKDLSISGDPILEASATGGTGTITYTWSNESRPTGSSTPTITTPNKPSTTVTGINAVGTYTFKVIATDANGKTNSAIATIITSNVEPKIVGSFAGYYSGNSANTFKFNITPDLANTTVDVVVGGTTTYNNRKTTYIYVPGMAGAVDTLKNCSFMITAPDGSIYVSSFMGIFSADYKTLTIKNFRLSTGSSIPLDDFTLTKL